MNAAPASIGQETMPFTTVKIPAPFMYSENVLNCKNFMPIALKDEEALCSKMQSLLIGSSAKSTWGKHFSAWKLYQEFCEFYGIQTWPADIPTARAFTTWALSIKGLRSNTVKSYLSSITLRNTLANCEHNPLTRDTVISMILKGASNKELLSPPNTKVKLSVNPHMMPILSHRIANANWSDLSKQVVWTAMLTCYFSSCRMGELVGQDEIFYDSSTILTWGNLNFVENDGIIIYLPYTKTKGTKGDFIDLFYYSNPNFCPVTNLVKLKDLLIAANIFSTDNPVFMLGSGRLLTKTKLNTVLDKFLCDTFDNKRFKITCHSFRTSMPTLLDSLGCKGSESKIKNWGRWS